MSHTNGDERKEQVKIRLKSSLIPKISTMNRTEIQTTLEPEDLSMKSHLDQTEDSESPGRLNGDKGIMDAIHGRKLIGIRYLFPHFPENLSLLDRTKIWVARHDYGYFVGWTQKELQQMDPVLRPVREISLELYKKHMNRSEYCRNVKLKYCLESDTPWAQLFRDKLSKDYQHGGFKGLCEVKQTAAELWRSHSEKYRSNQARYPNPKSRYKRLQPEPSVKHNVLEESHPVKKRSRYTSCEADTDFSEQYGMRSTVSSPGMSNTDLSVREQKTSRSNSVDMSSQHKGQYKLLKESLTNDLQSNMTNKHNSNNPSTYASILNQTIEKLCKETDEAAKRKSTYKYPEEIDTLLYKNITAQDSPSSLDSGIDGPGNDVISIQSGNLTEPTIFAALPETMSVKEKMGVWLERHKRSYFVNVSATDLALVPVLLRPNKCLTSVNLDEEVSVEFREAMEVYGNIKSLNDLLSLRFMQCLNLDQEKGFSGVSEVLAEGLSVQKQITEHKKHTGTIDHEEEYNEALAESWAREARKQLYFGGEDSYYSAYNHTLTSEPSSQANDNKHFSGDSLSDSCVYNGISVVRPTSISQNVYNIYENNSGISNEMPNPYENECQENGKYSQKSKQKCGDMTECKAKPELYEPVYNYSKNDFVTKTGITQSLWSYRNHLQNLCKDDTKLSWKQKLEPFLPVLKDITGNHYEIPDTTNKCIVDMVLVMLHSAIMDQ